MAFWKEVEEENERKVQIYRGPGKIKCEVEFVLEVTEVSGMYA